ncbi:MBL fold metallo-hydrolase [Solihabitans fulvus]|uniref:MBL fold metallo-hydrolase n=1 Tax=Solihabitans fulvus TaxID=1892852 RepID=A0A5B2XUI5_9PSEU|nr:MBL fold metallo-hydrolase [Solihabitans fulvus]KAA2266983.1 MBL fold metallo-hydrolase [Solihabitans fulvus]
MTAVAPQRVVVGSLDTNCWIVRAEGARQALLVDPGDEAERVLAAVAGLDVTAIVLTHTHYDHVLGVAPVAAALGVPVLGHAEEEAVWRHELAHLAEHGHFDAGTATDELLAEGRPPRPTAELWSGDLDGHLTDGQVLQVGPLRVEVLHTPGHTPGGVSLSADGHVFTGDTLFPGGSKRLTSSKDLTGLGELRIPRTGPPETSGGPVSL